MKKAKTLLIIICLMFLLFLSGCDVNEKTDINNKEVEQVVFYSLCKQQDGTFKQVTGGCNEK